MTEFDQFLAQTEGQQDVLTHKHEVKYPLLYIESVTDYELAQWIKNKVLTYDAVSEDSVQLYLKRETTKFLGYVELNLNSILEINKLMDRNLRLKKDKATEVSVKDNIVNLLLLRG